MRIQNAGNDESGSFEQQLADLRGLVWHMFIKGKISFEDLAAKAGLHQKTVENVAWGDTKRPHLRTRNLILDALQIQTFYRLPGSKTFIRASRFRNVKIPQKP